MKFRSLKQFERIIEQHDKQRGDSYQLNRMQQAVERLQHPDRNYKIIHVTGTSGKGSTCAMLSSILQAAGHSVGLFVSPHLITIRERIVVNNRLITERQLLQLVNRLWTKVSDLNLTYFEWCTLSALVFFAQRKVEYVVLEVGMGGRLDATNIVSPVLAIVTVVGFDHMEQLGNTLPKIAKEKAAIIKPGCIGLTGSRYVKRGRYVDTARAKITTATLAGTTFTYGPFQKLQLNLVGAYQVNNAVLAIDAALALHVSRRAIAQGLRQVKQRARFEVLSHRPLIIVDGAHNPQKMQAFVGSLRVLVPLQNYSQRSALISVKYTKDLYATLRPLIPLLDTIYITSFAQSAPIQQIKAAVRSINPYVKIIVEPNLIAAHHLFRKKLDKHAIGIITGSLYMIGNLYSVL
ncbi:MAG: hypothetical protein ACD_43C00017G0002 [uncultured bacterium]|nr:MAG: hypothetical protein ACD_43C00017G0002 [uncultured bacterium]